MSLQFIEEAKTERENKNLKRVINYMGEYSYEYSPIETLKMVTASSIFGEPSYYQEGGFEKYKLDKAFVDYDLFGGSFHNMTTSEIMIKVITDALDYDFKKTLEWAVKLRNQYYIRLNPQIIMVLAANHPKRAEFTKNNPGLFIELEQKVMTRADEPSVQCAFQLFLNHGKNQCPNILKKAWANKLESLDKYQIAKYKKMKFSMIDTVRICHAHSTVLDELMRTGKINVSDDEKTWESLRSMGMSWKEILSTINLPYMALLRNLRGIFTEGIDEAQANQIMKRLKEGVLDSKQFPFRYYMAYKMLVKEDFAYRGLLLDTLEECLDIARDNMPKLKGKTICLSDNSGSAWTAIPSEYGSVSVATIGNLSSLITAQGSEEGSIGIFGNKLKIFPVSKRNGLLTQLKYIEENTRDIGAQTENGIWLFFKEAIEKKIYYDNIFIYSDMQAGHAQLYGLDTREYKQYASGQFVDVMKLLALYRSKVNPKVNFFSVQTAGYTNAVVPEYGYRSNLLYGWTGKELQFADIIISEWNQIEANKNHLA